MSGIFGNKLKISIFGESHGQAIGITIDGLTSGIKIDMEAVEKEMQRRAPGSQLSTPRKESDLVNIVSGVFEGYTTGNPLTGIIYNENTKSKDYTKTKDLMRPSHSDYGYYVKQNGFNDYRGGGHSSGRITAPLVFCGAICKQILAKKGIEIVAHISSIKDIQDKKFDLANITSKEIELLKSKDFKVLDSSKEETMKNAISDAQENKDSVGGTIECAILGVNAGIGDPFFDSIESELAHLLFSVPAVKGVQFGLGYEMTKMNGSQVNDEFYMDGDKILTKSNNNGGVLGGIYNGMPIVFDVAIKPTASIFKEQNTINIQTKQNEKITIQGRHDPCIVLRAVPVIEAVAAIAIMDLI